MIALILFNLWSLTMLFCGLLSFILNWNRLLNTLLSLEFLMLSIFWIMSLNMSFIEIYMFLFILTVGVYEEALCLSLLISVVHSHGNEYFSSFSLLSCFW